MVGQPAAGAALAGLPGGILRCHRRDVGIRRELVLKRQGRMKDRLPRIVARTHAVAVVILQVPVHLLNALGKFCPRHQVADAPPLRVVDHERQLAVLRQCHGDPHRGWLGSVGRRLWHRLGAEIGKHLQAVDGGLCRGIAVHFEDLQPQAR